MYSEATPMMKLFIFIVVLLVCTAAFSIGGVAFAPLFFGTDAVLAMADEANYTQPNVLAVLKFLQIFSQLGIMIIPSLMAGVLFSEGSLAYISANKDTTGQNYLLVFILMFAITPLLNLIIQLNANMHLPEALKAIEKWMQQSEEQAAKLTKAFMKMESRGDLLLNLVMVALLPAIGEEFLFRGVIQNLLSQLTRKKHAAIIITAVLFSAIHMQFFGFFPRFLLGVLLGYLLVWSGSIWLPVFAHFLNNGMAVMASWLQQHYKLEMDPDTIGAHPEDWWMLVLSGIITLALLRKLSGNFGKGIQDFAKAH